MKKLVNRLGFLGAACVLSGGLLAGGCSTDLGPPLALQSMSPNVGLTDERTTVTIIGSGFFADSTIDVGGGQVTPDLEFNASLGATALENVTWVDTQTLTAEVPAGVPIGTYDLLVSSVGGSSASLSGAFTIQEPANVPVLEITAFTVSPTTISAGQTVTLSYLVVNTGRVDANNVRLEDAVAIGAPAAPIAALSPTSAPIPVNQQAAFTHDFRVTGPGSVIFSTTAVGTDALTTDPVASGPSQSNMLTVLRPAQLTASLSASATQVSVGDDVTLEMSVSNNGESTAANVIPSALVEAGTGTTSGVPGASPASVAALNGAANTLFSWTVTTTGAGELSYSGNAGGDDALSVVSVGSATVSTPTILVQTSPVLTAAVQPIGTIGVNQSGVLVRVQVTNSGEADAVIASPADAALQATPPDGITINRSDGTTVIPGGETREITFRVDVDGTVTAGTMVTFDTQVVAQDGNNGNTVSSPFGSGGDATVTIALADQPADLSVTSFVITGPTGAQDGVVSSDQDYVVTAIVENVGTCNVNADGVLTFDLGTTGATTSDSLTRTLVPGNPEVLNLKAPSNAAAVSNLTVTITTTPTHVDEIACGMTVTVTTGSDTVAIETVAAAQLELTASIVSPPEATDGVVGLDDLVNIDVVVTNLGTAAVIGTAELILDTGTTNVQLLNPASLTQPFIVGIPVSFNLQAPSTATASDDLIASILTTPNDENTGQTATVSQSMDPVTLETVDDTVCSPMCDSMCGSGTSCCDDTCNGNCGTCPSGCTCNYECTDDCNAVCVPGSTCIVTANDVSNVEDIVCNNATCDVTCDDVSNCFLQCNGGNADCILRCQDVSNCEIVNCPTTVENCGGGVKVCGIACP